MKGGGTRQGKGLCWVGDWMWRIYSLLVLSRLNRGETYSLVVGAWILLSLRLARCGGQTALNGHKSNKSPDTVGWRQQCVQWISSWTRRYEGHRNSIKTLYPYLVWTCLPKYISKYMPNCCIFVIIIDRVIIIIDRFPIHSHIGPSNVYTLCPHLVRTCLSKYMSFSVKV